MKKILIIFLLISCFFKQGYSSIADNDSLLFFEEKIFRCNENDKNNWILKKYTYLKTHNYYENALKTIKRVDHKKIDSIQKSNCFFEEALMNFQLANFNETLNNLEYARKYHTLNYAKTLLLETLCFSELNEWQLCKTNLYELYNYFNLDTNKLSGLITIVDTTYKKNTIASILIPGLGIIINGKPIKGLTSFILNTAAITATIGLLKTGAYTTSFMWFSNVTARLYYGNIKLTIKSAEDKKIKKINKTKEQYYNHIALLLNQENLF